MYEYCRQRAIPTLPCGKLIVAVEPAEIAALRQLYQRGLVNGVPDLAYIDSNAALREIEPHCAALAAVHCPSTGVVDYARVGDAPEPLHLRHFHNPFHRSPVR